MQYTEIELIKETDKSSVIIAIYDNRPVVVKKLYKANHLVFETLMKEKNPYVPEIYSVTQCDDYIEVIEEYVEGETLDNYLAKNNLDNNAKLDLVLNLCDVLIYLHSLTPSLIHRDIKPSNILITKSGKIKLIDFDAARFYNPEKRDSDTVLLGTREYAAPEQFGYSQTDIRTDIYSLGIVLNGLGVTFSAPSFDSKFRQIVDRCTRFDPNDRYANVMSLRRELEELKSEKPIKRKKYLIFAAGVLLAAIISTVAIFVLRPTVTSNNPDADAVPEVVDDIIPDDTEKSSSDEQPESLTDISAPIASQSIDNSSHESLASEDPDNSSHESPASEDTKTTDSIDTSSDNIDDAVMTSMPTGKVYYNGPYYDVDYLEGNCVHNNYINDSCMHIENNLKAEQYCEFSQETVDLFDKVDSDFFNHVGYEEYFPGELGKDLNITMYMNSIIGYTPCAILIDNMINGDLYRVPDDMWYTCCGAVYIDYNFMSALDNTLYMIRVYSVNEEGSLMSYIDRVVNHDENMVFDANFYRIPTSERFIKNQNSRVVFAMDANCPYSFKEILNNDFTTCKYATLSDDGRCFCIDREAFINLPDETNVSFYCRTSEDEFWSYDVIIMDD